MPSSHISRGRILFEVACAFAFAASLVGAWQQTYAPALLGAAGVAGLYGLVHFFDLFRRAPALAEPVAATAPVADSQGDMLVYLADEPAEELAPPPAVEVQPEPEQAVEAPPIVFALSPAPEARVEELEPVKAVARRSRKIKPVEAVEEPAPLDLVIEPVADPAPVQAFGEIDADYAEPAPIAPLFEPAPFVRQHNRGAFGRKAGRA